MGEDNITDSWIQKAYSTTSQLNAAVRKAEEADKSKGVHFSVSRRDSYKGLNHGGAEKDK